MEFHEKLQELRKRRGLTQEELAEALYVSRTAISKWESGREYPSIDSLKEISTFFSVSIDDLLSGDKLISIAEKENRSNMQDMCHFLFGMTDLLSFLLILLPLYPETIDGHVYSVTLWQYKETAAYNRTMYWILFLALVACGIWKICVSHRFSLKSKQAATWLSLIISLVTILYLVLAREAYAATVAILLMIVKGLLMVRLLQTNR